MRWISIDTRPLRTGRYLVGHQGWQEVMVYFAPPLEKWAPGSHLGFHRLMRRGWVWCDPAVAFNATHCALIEGIPENVNARS